MNKLLAALALSWLINPAAAATLDITLDGVSDADGHVLIWVENQQAGWDGDAAEVVGAKLAARSGAIQHRFEDLPPGQYAVHVIHDRNDNGRLDTNFVGMPKEDFGYSLNPTPMRRAHFDEAKFELPAEGRALQIVMQ